MSVYKYYNIHPNKPGWYYTEDANEAAIWLLKGRKVQKLSGDGNWSPVSVGYTIYPSPSE